MIRIVIWIAVLAVAVWRLVLAFRAYLHDKEVYYKRVENAAKARAAKNPNFGNSQQTDIDNGKA